MLSDIDIYIIPLGTLKESLFLATKLREQGKKVEIEMTNKKIKKALERASKEQYSFVIVVGEEEVVNNKYKLVLSRFSHS